MRRAAPPHVVEHAACRGQLHKFLLPEFEVERDSAKDRRKMIPLVAEARHICHRCPVFVDCREWALSTPDPLPGGVIAGGLAPWERAQERRRRHPNYERHLERQAERLRQLRRYSATASA